jgi:hypothetical protein
MDINWRLLFLSLFSLARIYYYYYYAETHAKLSCVSTTPHGALLAKRMIEWTRNRFIRNNTLKVHTAHWQPHKLPSLFSNGENRAHTQDGIMGGGRKRWLGDFYLHPPVYVDDPPNESHV